MGVRVISDMRAFAFGQPASVRLATSTLGLNKVGPRLTRRPNQSPTIELHYDGSTTVGNDVDCPSSFNGNIAWFDPSMLIRSGTNLGITATFIGTGSAAGQSVDLYGSSEPSELAYSVFDPNKAGVLIPKVDATWYHLGSIVQGTPLAVGFTLYTLMRAVFTGTGGATLQLTSR